MSKTDTSVTNWKPLDSRKDSKLMKFLSDTGLSAMRSEELSVNGTYCLQGTSKRLHNKPKIPVRPAWVATPGSLEKTTRPMKFLNVRKAPSRLQNTNNSTSSDADFRYNRCVTKCVEKQGATNNVKECKLSKFDGSIDGLTEQRTNDNDMPVLNTQSTSSHDMVESNSGPKHRETTQGMTVVELFPGVTSYILDESLTVQNNESNSKDNTDNESNYEDKKESKEKLKEPLFSTLKECPSSPDNSDDDTALSWYRQIVELELEIYLNNVHRKISEECDQEATRQSVGSRQHPQILPPSKTVDNEQMQEMTQIRRINKTDRYVRYLLWKENIAKSKDRLDVARNNPSGN